VARRLYASITMTTSALARAADLRTESLLGDLITATTGIRKRTENHRRALEFALSNVRYHKFLDTNERETLRAYEEYARWGDR